MVPVAALLAVFGALLALMGVVAFFWFLASGLRNAWEAARASGRCRYHLVLASVSLGGALMLAGVPFVATWSAEGQNNWTDVDGDGMLDGFVNGAYDWMDVNGGDWFRAAGLMVAIVVGVAVALSRAVKRAGPGGLTGSSVPRRREDWGDPWADDRTSADR